MARQLPSRRESGANERQSSSDGAGSHHARMGGCRFSPGHVLNGASSEGETSRTTVACTAIASGYAGGIDAVKGRHSGEFLP